MTNGRSDAPRAPYAAPPRGSQPAEADTSRSTARAPARASAREDSRGDSSKSSRSATAVRDTAQAQDQYGNAAVVRANGRESNSHGVDKAQGDTTVTLILPTATGERAEKERRLARAGRQLKTPETVVDPPLLPPLALPPEMPLIWTPIVSLFAAPPAPEFDIKKWGDHDPKGHQAILDSARHEYESVTLSARRHHDEMCAESTLALQTITWEYQISVSQLESEFVRNDDRISQSFGTALQTLRSGAEAADLIVLENYLAARDALSGASSSMKKEIKKNADTAVAQTDKIITDLASDFVKPLETTRDECTQKADTTRSVLETWKASSAKLFPLEGSPANAVENEAKLSVALELADNALTQLKTKTTQVIGRFKTNITQVNRDIRARVGPSLQAHAEKIEPEGTATVTTAFNKAFSSLLHNANQARDAVAKTHAQTVEQLTELRQAERERLEAEMKSALSVAHDEAQAASTTLQNTATSTLPHYGEAVVRLHNSMSDSAKRGPQMLEGVTGAAVQVADTVAHAREVQQQQIEMLQAGVVSGLASHEMHSREEGAVSAATAEANFSESSLTTTKDMVKVAQAMTQGLSSLSAGVIAAAQDWIRPLEQAFATFLTEVKTDLTNGRQDFLTRVNTAKTDFLSWLAPQSNPSHFFAEDLKRAAIEAREKVQTAKQSLYAALDAGIIDVIDETGVGNALRGLTRLQGQLLRSMWTKTWPKYFDSPLMRLTYQDVVGSDVYTLDGHLLVALGPGSDDYNAAINYLNGNTAEGARYEMEASMHWYNDEEARMENIMRGLTPQQLAELQTLPAWEKTRKKAQDALDGTDLSVFNALDKGDLFAADAYRMRDELNAARERNDKDATNAVLAKYSKTPNYTGRRVTAEERRAGVQTAFARIQGVDLQAKADEMTRQREAEAAKQAPAVAPAPGIQAAVPGVPAPAAAATPGSPAPTVAGQPAASPPAVVALPNGIVVPMTSMQLPGQGPHSEPRPPSLADRWMSGAVAEPGTVVAPDGTRPSVTQQEAASQALFEYATRNITVLRSTGEGGSYEETLTFEGRDRDLARALIFFGEGSPEARAAQLGVEAQRPGKPDILKVDSALVDPRLNPDLPVRDANARREIQARALEDRRRMLEIYARDYGGLPPGSTTDHATVLINQLDHAFGSDKAGSELAARLVRENYPTPQTASLAMEYAIEGAGTNNELVDRTLGRMNRDEIAEMRKDYKARTGRDLYTDLGVFSHGWFGDLSGDDRLRAERMLLGVPRNDRERAEVAAFTIQQQRDETGLIGGWLASGSMQDIALTEQEQELNALIGGPIAFGPDGTPQWTNKSAFRDDQFIGDAGDFASTIVGARLAAENYSAKIDQYANAAAMGIAVLGAIVAAVVTVATGGAASPLLMAAIAGITGLAAMGAQRLIKGGRYGWEDAVTDLGMTAVSALTAGVGQALALASRGGVGAVQAASKAGMSISAAQKVAQTPGLLGHMGRLTGSAYLDKILIGVSTGGLSSFGQAAINEDTWKHGRGLENLFGATMRGMVGGGVTAGVTNAIEDVPLGRLSRLMGGKNSIGEAIGGSTNVLSRGIGKGITSSIGATAGRAAELSVAAGQGAHKMDAGDILIASAQHGGMSFFQSFAEGGFEARAQALYNARFGPPQPPTEVPVARPPTAPETTTRVPGTADVETPGTRMPAAEQPELARPIVTAPETETARAVRPVTPVEEPVSGRPAVAPEEEITEAPSKPVPVTTPAEGRTPPDAARGILEEAAKSNTPRAPMPEKEGAAAAIPGSRMRVETEAPGAPRLAELEGHATPKALEDAVNNAVGRARSLAESTVEKESDNAQIVNLKRADQTEMRVRVVFGDTGSSDVATFRAGTMEEGADYVVTLSKRASPELHARAVAHELAEIRIHGLEGHAAPTDLLTTRTPAAPDSRLSAHDAGRLAELDVLAAEFAAVRPRGPDDPAVRSLQSEIDALAGHLGLLHTEEGDLRFKAAIAVLGEDSPARQALNDARERTRQASLGDALHPSRRIDESTQLSTRDRNRLAQLEELGARIDALEAKGVMTPKGIVSREPAATRQLELEAVDLLTKMGLLGADPITNQRAKLAGSAFDPDSAGARLLENIRRSVPQADINDALRPGLTPDELTVLSPRDLKNVNELQSALRKLVHAEQSNADPVEIARLRHDAEAEAARMGLVHGEKAADARTQFLRNNKTIPEASRLDDALAARLEDVRKTAKQSPLLRPRLGTIDDLPLLSRQIADAAAMGDHELVRGLIELAGARLEASGAFAEDADVRSQARTAIDKLVENDPAARALAEDALARHGERLNAKALRSEADSIRVTIENLKGKLEKAEERVRDHPRSRIAKEDAAGLRNNVELLERDLQSIEAAASASERVAFRPGGRSAEEARAAAAGDPGFPTTPRFRQDPDYAGAREQQILARQLFADLPDFQTWSQFKNWYAEINHTIRIGGTLSSTRTSEIADVERVFRLWLQGRYVSPEAPLGRMLSVLEIIHAETGVPVKFHEPGTQEPVRLAPDEQVKVKDLGDMTVSDAETRRRDLIDQRNILAAQRRASQDATEQARIEKEIHKLIPQINNISEALGEQAGRRFAATLPGGLTHISIDRGSGVTDIIHIDPVTKRVTVIECKGGSSELGGRNVTDTLGRPARAEQTTPEYLRSLATEMTHNEDTRDAGLAILAALNSDALPIDVFVVRQPLDAQGNCGSIEVTKYPVTRSGK